VSFNEAQHPRNPAGSPKGGEFASKGGLSPVESAAISDWSDTGDDEIRRRPNSTQGKIFRDALSKLPPHTGLLYRGLDETAMSPKGSSKLFEELQPGDTMILPQLSSWSKKLGVAMDFTNPDSPIDRPGVLLRVRTNKSPHFKDITDHMIEDHQWGEEVVCDENVTFRVAAVQARAKVNYMVLNPYFDNYGKSRIREVHVIDLEEV
jgi:hypothetical protein